MSEACGDVWDDLTCTRRKGHDGMHIDETKFGPLDTLEQRLLRTEQRLAAVEALAEQYAGWLREVTEVEWSTPCRLDHNGECQEHGYFDGPCPIPLIRAALTAAPDSEDRQAGRALRGPQSPAAGMGGSE